MKRSTVPPCDSGFGFFAIRPFEASEVVRYYYETLSYAPLGIQLTDGKVYGDVVMSVLSDAILTWALCPINRVKPLDGERNI